MLDLSNIPDKVDFKNTTSHKFKADLFDFFKNKNLNTCLELGTNHGWTTRILSFIFQNVFTVDVRQDNIHNAKLNNKDRTNITYYTADVYSTDLYDNLPKIDVGFIDCVHSYECVIKDINTCIKLMDIEKGIYLIFDDYGHPVETGIKRAVDDAVRQGLKIEREIGEDIGFQFNALTKLINREGIILSYGIS